MSLVGSLKDLGFGEILQIVSLSRKSGFLSLHSRNREGVIVFRRGKVVRASSNAYGHYLGQILIQKGSVESTTLEKALLVQEQHGFKERLGVILNQHFGISSRLIEEAAGDQIRNVIYSLFIWEEGSFEFQLKEEIDASDGIGIDPVQFMLEQGLDAKLLNTERLNSADVVAIEGPPEPESDEADAAVEEKRDVACRFPLPETADDVTAVATSSGEAKPHIILIDDDAETRDIIASFLQANEYRMSPFSQSRDAVARIEELYSRGVRPVVVTDLIMPRMDGSGILGGLELLEIIDGKYAGTPVLVTADCHNDEAEEKIREMGFTLIMKPRKGEFSDPVDRDIFMTALLSAVGSLDAVEESGRGGHPESCAKEEPEEVPGEVEPVAISDPADSGISLLKDILGYLNNPSFGENVIQLLLGFAARLLKRGILLEVSGQEVRGVAQFGMGGEEKAPGDTEINELRMPLANRSFFSKVLGSHQPAKLQPDDSKWSRYFSERIGGLPQEVFVGPILSEERVIAILYGDNFGNGEDKPVGNTDSLEILLSQAGMALEKAFRDLRFQEIRPEVT